MLAMAKEKEKRIAGSLRKAAGRARLMALASEGVELSQQQREIERLRAYLLDWSWRQKEYGPRLGIAGSCLEEYMKSASPTAIELFSKSDGWAASVIEASIDDLIGVPQGTLMRAALRVRYLNEGLSREPGEMKIRVFRAGRLTGLSLEETDALADRAETLLIPIVKRRGLPL